MSWGENTYLKDPNTLTILPAPPETREEGIAWYEIQIQVEGGKSAHLLGFDKEGVELERLEVSMRPSDESSVRLSSTYTKDGQRFLNAECTAIRTSEDELAVALKTDSDETTLSIRPSGPDSTRRSREIELAVPDHWHRLIDPLEALAHALSVRAITSNSWSCEACVALAPAMWTTIILCGSTSSALACQAAYRITSLFVENCIGACALEDESG